MVLQFFLFYLSGRVYNSDRVWLLQVEDSCNATMCLQQQQTSFLPITINRLPREKEEESRDLCRNEAGRTREKDLFPGFDRVVYSELTRKMVIKNYIRFFRRSLGGQVRRQRFTFHDTGNLAIRRNAQYSYPP